MRIDSMSGGRVKQGMVGEMSLMLVLAFSLFCCSAAVAIGGEHGGGEGGAWHWRVGAARRSGTRISASWREDDVVGRVAPYFRSTSFALPASIGPMDGYADRDYDDGFVYIDYGTDDPETEVPGLTWFWGYDEAGQYDGAAVSFRSEPGRTQRIVPVDVDPWEESDQFDVSGLDFGVGRRLWQRGRFAMSLDAGVTWYSDQSSEFRLSRTVARETDRGQRYVDTYDATHQPFPDAPYAGTLEGPGYLIHNRPDSRELQDAGGRSRDWIADSALDVDFDMLDLRLGPSLRVRLHERIALRLAPQLRAAQVEAKASSHTVIAPTTVGPIEFTGRENVSEWIMGVGVEGNLSLEVYRGWRLGLSVSANQWQDDVNLYAEPFDAKIELGQYAFSVSLGRGL